jgi:hypothetical protein
MRAQSRWVRRQLMRRARTIQSRTIGRALALPDHPGEDFVEAFAALHQDDLDLPFILADAVGDPILSV